LQRKEKKMSSKATTLRQKSATKVIASGRTHKDRIGESMAERYGQDAGSAAVLLVTSVTDDLEAKTGEMVRCDDAHEAELRDDPEARVQRDEASGALHDRLVDTREQLSAVCGADYTAKLGFSGSTPDDPVEVSRLGKTVVENLAKVKAPEPKIPGYKMDPELWRKPLAELVEQAQGLVSRVAAEEREAEATLLEKRAAIEKYDEAFSSTANMVSTLLAIAGEKDLARRVRPSTRRAGQTAEDAPNTGSESDNQ
jgi:hypothetical protein